MRFLIAAYAAIAMLCATAEAKNFQYFIDGKTVVSMAPVSDRGERKVSVEEAIQNVQEQARGRNKSREAYVPTEQPETFYRPNDDDEDQEQRARPRINSSSAQRDIYCLTEAIYFESLHEPEQGKIAVANVIMNRASWNDRKPPNAAHRREFSGGICDVVNFKVRKEYHKRVGRGKHKKWVWKTHTTCAFSYRCERAFKRKLSTAVYRPVWGEIKALASDAYLRYNSDENTDPSHGATFYHANYVRPCWRREYQKTTQIGAHIFYRIR